MQQDQSGVYRVNTSSTSTNSRQIDASLTSPDSPAAAGLTAQSAWTLTKNDSSEASAAGHYGHPYGCPIGQIFESR
jgi:hypothetical protein